MNITIINQALPNGKPTLIGSRSISIDHNSQHVFTVANFTTETSPPYYDPEGDDMKYIVILSIPTGLGELKVDGVNVVLNQLVYSAEISSGKLVYHAPASVEESNQSVFRFDVADVGSSNVSGLDRGVVTISVAEKVNEPPTVGDNNLSVNSNETLTFTKEHFVDNTTPAFSDPENQDAEFLKVLTLPTNGTLIHNSSSVTQNQIIPFTEIVNGLFIYSAPNLQVVEDFSFDFSISEAGSNIFTE